MKIGMLWFDNNPKTSTDEKVKKASDYYAKKYGAAPNVCWVSPGVTVTVENIKVVESKTILPAHFWIGVE